MYWVAKKIYDIKDIFFLFKKKQNNILYVADGDSILNNFKCDSFCL